MHRVSHVELYRAPRSYFDNAVESHLDTNTYPAGQKVSDAQMATIQLQRDAFHGEWNYTIAPHDPPPDEVVL